MTTPTPTSAPLLTIGWTTAIGHRSSGYDYANDEEIVEPVTIGEMVTDALAARLYGPVARGAEKIQHEAMTRLRTQTAETVVEVVREEVATAVRAALREPIQRTDTFGKPVGEPTSLNELIVAEVRAYLDEPPARWNSDERPNGFRKLLREAVGDALNSDLRTVATEARAKVQQAVREKANEVFGAALTR